MDRRRQILVLKVMVWWGGLTPAALLVWRGFADRLGANPIEEVLHHLGRSALIFLIITLSVTPYGV